MAASPETRLPIVVFAVAINTELEYICYIGVDMIAL
jgi:hypothetical protein